MAIFGDGKLDNTLELDFDPFDSGEACSHFFSGGNRRALLDQLVEICCYGSDPAVVTGPLGSGKSTLRQWLELSLDEEFVVATVSATLFMSAEQLLEALCENLSLDGEEGASTEELLEQLDQYAESLRARSHTLQLLVDDAHELGEEALQALLELLERQADPTRLGEDGIKVVLFGEPMLLNTVGQLFPSSQVQLELEPLNSDEIFDYVAFKLSSAGYQGRMPLHIDAMTVIEARSRGVPGAINAMVKDELGRTITPRASQHRLGFVERNLAAASALFAVLLLTLFFTLGGDDDSPLEEELFADNTEGPAIRSQTIEIPLQISNQQEREDVADSGGSPEAQPETPAAGTEPEFDRPVGQQTALVTRLMTPTSNSSEVPELSTNVENVSPDAVVPGSVLPEKETIGIPELSQSPAGLSAAERELLAKSPESYTVQLLGSHSEANVKDFIASNGTPTGLSYFESSFQDRPWFVVVQGSYPNRAAAREAIDRLPAALRDLQPWARTLSDIQADIRRPR